MKAWRILYIILLGLGFGLGWLISPMVGVAFVWAMVILFEFLHYRWEEEESEREFEETKLSEHESSR